MKTILTLFACLFIQHIAAQTLPGLDPSFGNNGIVLDSGIGLSFKKGGELAIQQDGKIVTTGMAHISRYLGSGKPDTTFGINGTVPTIPFSDALHRNVFGNGIYILSNGKLISIQGFLDSGRVVRYLPDGQIDSSYGTHGMTDAPFYELDCSALQTDGKLLVAGLLEVPYHYMQIDRFTANGLPDSSFGTNGVALVRNNYASGSIAGMGVMADGRIVLGGMGFDSNDNRSAMIICLLPDGRQDSSLGGTGRLCIFNVSYCRAMLLQPDGKVLLSVGELTGDAHICRVDTNGSIDSSFGQAGFASVPSVRITAMKLLPDGRLLCGGYDGDFVLARLLPDGSSLDSSFGVDGVIRTDVSGSRQDRAYALALQQDGKLILGGEGYGLTLVRYLPDAQTAVKQTEVSALRIYPNPAQSSIIVELRQSSLVGSTYRICDVNGRQILKGGLSGLRTTIDVSALAPGNYLLSVSSVSFSKTHLFIKQ